MPSRTTYTRRTGSGNPIHQEISRTGSAFLLASYWPENAEGDRIAYQGAVCAILWGGIPESDITISQPYVVPYSPSAAYGTGSDTPAGILPETYDATYSDWQVTLVDRGVAVRNYCYVPGGAYGDIPAAVVTALSGITWRH